MHNHHSTPNDYTPRIDRDEFELPSWPSLDEFTSDAERNDGVQVDSLAPGTKVRVETKNSEYWLTILEGGRRRVLIQGGILADESEARVEGATDGGAAIHTGWIEKDRSLELICGPRRIITSRVCGISIEQPGAPPSHRAA